MTRNRELIERVCRAVLDGGPVPQEDIAAMISALCMAEERVAALAGLVSEARTDLAAYVEAEWPEAHRANYPPIQAKWKRDMELCWRIDAAIAATKGGAQ